MEPYLLAWLDENNITERTDNRGLPLYGYGPDSSTLSNWRFPFPPPTALQLSNVNLNRHMKKERAKRYKDNELFPLIVALCKRLKIDVDDLLSED